MPLWLQAGLWGLLAGSALLAGAGLGYAVRLPVRLIAGVMAFGAGVLISALSFDLMDEAFRQGGFVPAALGFLSGAAVYSAANHRRGLPLRVRAQQAGRLRRAPPSMTRRAGAQVLSAPYWKRRISHTWE